MLAHHFTEAGLAEKAIGYWLKAGLRSQERSANVEAIVVRAKQLARERGLVVFDSFERSAAALRVSYDYWSGRAARESA